MSDASAAAPRRDERGGPLPRRLAVTLCLAAALAGARGAYLPAQERDQGRGGPVGQVPERIEADPELERVARYGELAEGSEDPVDWYNYGTALLRRGRWEEAREALRRAAPAENATVETFARYNQALASAESGRRVPGRPEGGRERLLEARDAFRAVLRREPGAEDARWNLELVERWLRRQQGGGGDGAGAGQARSSGAGSALPQGGDETGAPRELGPDEARVLLEAAGEAEASVRDRLLGRARLRDPVVERNW